jgi:hypothetical protein
MPSVMKPAMSKTTNAITPVKIALPVLMSASARMP